jgi:cyclopropane-fatty-acyl-phospholipid synthase
MTRDKSEQLLAAAKDIASTIAETADLDLYLQLWDGERVALGRNVQSDLAITIDSPGVVSSILRWPTLDRMIRHYARGDIELEGGTLIDLGERVSTPEARRRLKTLPKGKLARLFLPFVTTPSDKPERGRDFSGDAVGEGRSKDDNRDFIQFHYDVGNEFYRLFLDPDLLYSCAYFEDRNNTLEQAQQAKLEMICRKLRLKPGDRFLDIGCGWGALICYAAKNFGVTAHGITLSDEQLTAAKDRIRKLGLEDQVTVESRDYQDLDGTYDKVASVGMYEHIGLKNIPTYMTTVRNVLADDGLFLNHAIARRAKKKQKRFSARAEQKALVKYIFPGGELDDIGHTLREMEKVGFEVQDVEAWRWHYGQTTRIWCDRLYANRAQAEALVGAPTTRIWLAYLAGCSLAFQRGSARIFQTLVSKSAKGPPPLPSTRADLYR